MVGKKYTIYIRDTDDALWQAVPNKSEWIHKLLNVELEATIDFAGSSFIKDFPVLASVSNEPVVIPIDE